MFKCEKCQCISHPGEKQCTLVVEKRSKTYTYYLIKGHFKENPFWTASKIRADQEGTRIVKTRDIQGWEIVREIKICNKCQGETSHA